MWFLYWGDRLLWDWDALDWADPYDSDELY